MERRVRVAIRTYTEYDEDKVAHLPGIEHVEMEEFFSADYARCAEAKRIAEAVEQKATTRTQAGAHAGPVGSAHGPGYSGDHKE